MGVRGLTTYLRENKGLSTTFVRSKTYEDVISIVVDGWSFIYELIFNSNLPWVYGGEYLEFARLVSVVVRAWLDVGLKLYMVFDGPFPVQKFATSISRISDSIVKPSLLFFRTSRESRTSGRFLNENRITPPLLYSTCIHTLMDLSKTTEGLEVLFADEEGDPYAVELAGRVEGFVVGNDSDFVVLNSTGYMGYIPMEEMAWSAFILPEDPTTTLNDDDGFKPVIRTKRKVAPLLGAGRGIIPPDSTEGLMLSFIVYRPSDLASKLRIPVTLLPLLGSIVGNDFMSSSTSIGSLQVLFFDRRLSSSQRLEFVSKTIHSILVPSALQKKKRKEINGVMDLISLIVRVLLEKYLTTMGSGEVESIIDRIVESTLQYAIPTFQGDVTGQNSLWSSDVCPLHEPDDCRLVSILSNKTSSEETQIKRKSNIARYIKAYRNGNMSPRIMDALSTGTNWPRMFLENPDVETVTHSIGSPIRRLIYAILNEEFGLPVHPDINPVTSDNGDYDRSTLSMEKFDDDCELIDVVESDLDEGDSDTDYLAPLRGELNRLHAGDENDEEATSSGTYAQLLPPPPAIVIEHLRRGTRINQERTIVISVANLFSSLALSDAGIDLSSPILSQSEDMRLKLMRTYLYSNTNSITSLSPQKSVAVLAVRWVVKSLHLRALDTRSKERQNEQWTQREARCFLGSFSWSSLSDASTPEDSSQLPLVIDRHVQLTAQALVALDVIEQLSEALLLSGPAPTIAHLFSGKKFHSLLINSNPLKCNEECLGHMWLAATEGLDEAFQPEREKRQKKAEKQLKDTKLSNIRLEQQLLKQKQGLFSVLCDVND